LNALRSDSFRAANYTDKPKKANQQMSKRGANPISGVPKRHTRNRREKKGVVNELATVRLVNEDSWILYVEHIDSGVPKQKEVQHVIAILVAEGLCLNSGRNFKKIKIWRHKVSGWAGKRGF
jgi:hypothetical protein